MFKDDDQFVLLNCDNNAVDMKFAKSSGPILTFEPNVLKYAFSQLKKSNKNSGKKFAYVPESFSVYELKIPTRTESLLSIKNGKLAETKWIQIL